MTDKELDVLFKTVSEGIVTLYRESESQMGRARILFYALSGYLEEEGVIGALSASASWMETQTEVPKVVPTPSGLVH